MSETRSAMTVRVRRATDGDVESVRALARSVEALFGAPMGDDPEWNAHLARQIERGTAWVAVDMGASTDVLGGMWLSANDETVLHIRWLAVFPEARARGAGRMLVERAVAEAGARDVEVVTFGARHPGGAEAEAARRLYRRCGFVLADADERASDGTPRERLVRAFMR